MIWAASIPSMKYCALMRVFCNYPSEAEGLGILFSSTKAIRPRAQLEWFCLDLELGKREEAFKVVNSLLRQMAGHNIKISLVLVIRLLKFRIKYLLWWDLLLLQALYEAQALHVARFPNK